MKTLLIIGGALAGVFSLFVCAACYCGGKSDEEREHVKALNRLADENADIDYDNWPNEKELDMQVIQPPQKPVVEPCEGDCAVVNREGSE